jgi:hypothetical protein
MAILMAYYLSLLAPLKDPDGPWVLPLVAEMSDQNQTASLKTNDLPAVILTPRGETWEDGFIAGTRVHTFTVRIRILDRDNVEREKPRAADNPRNVAAITEEVSRLLSTGKGQDLTRTTPWLWQLDANQSITDFDAWERQPGQWSGRDIIVSASRSEAWSGAQNPQESTALPEGLGD